MRVTFVLTVFALGLAIVTASCRPSSRYLQLQTAHEQTRRALEACKEWQQASEMWEQAAQRFERIATNCLESMKEAQP